MSSNELRDLVFALQALRRRVERDAFALGGALGVAADSFPHQIANVARVLGDTEVRHLLADEVGLGKTVQALMVLNALRLQRPSLRAAILVPDTLMVQWREELRGRAHVAPEEGDTEPADEFQASRPALLWPEALGKLPGGRVVDALRRYDLLIVDELQLFTEELQRQVVAAATRASHVLLLTATPAFHDVARMDRLFQIIEPGRAAAVNGGALFEALRAREERASDLLAGGLWAEGELGGPPPSQSPRRAAALGHCTVRRVIRTRRDAWRGYMPVRSPETTFVEPTDAEVERQRLMWRYFRHLGELPRDIGLQQLAQRALRSPASLRPRVTKLRGDGHEREGLLSEVQRHLGPEFGDSRFDELCDILQDIWTTSHDARVLVCAGDNPTVDDLVARLPKLFDKMPSTGAPLIVASLRNQTRGPDALVPSEDIIAGAIRSFRSGDAQLLVAAEVGSSGLNLQCTRHLVLYSIPWDPHEVEQWIGRIDRIGNTAVGNDAGAVLPIVVHIIAQRGLVDERIVEIMRATTILERSISLDGARVAEVADSIQAAALAGDGAAWATILERAQELGASREIEELGLPLVPDLPWTRDAALALASRLRDARPTPPAMAGPAETGVRGRERALLGWLLAMKRAKEYDVREVDRGRGIGSFGYVDFGGQRRSLDQLARRPLDESLIAGLGRPFFFRHRRAKLEQPPVPEYARPNGPPRPLYFLDHGCPAHENLVDVWLRDAPAVQRFALRPPNDHPLAQLRGAAICLMIAHLDPAALIAESMGGSAKVLLAIEADRRFLLQHLPASLLLGGVSVRGDNTVQALPDDIVERFVAPAEDDLMLETRTSTWPEPQWLTDRLRLQAVERAASILTAKADAAWGGTFDELRNAIDDRCYVLETDRSDRTLIGDQSGADEARSRQDWLRASGRAGALNGVRLWRTVWCLLE
jgi:ATP-dependent helicase HepA